MTVGRMLTEMTSMELAMWRALAIYEDEVARLSK